MKRIKNKGGAAPIPSSWNQLTQFGKPITKQEERKPKAKICKKCGMPFKSEIPSSKGVRLLVLDGIADEKANKINYEFDRSLTKCQCIETEVSSEKSAMKSAMNRLMEERIGPNPTKLQRKKFRRIPGYSCV